MIFILFFPSYLNLFLLLHFLYSLLLFAASILVPIRLEVFLIVLRLFWVYVVLHSISSKQHREENKLLWRPLQGWYTVRVEAEQLTGLHGNLRHTCQFWGMISNFTYRYAMSCNTRIHLEKRCYFSLTHLALFLLCFL